MTRAFYKIKTSPPIEAESEAPVSAVNHIYVCPICGDIWAQVLCSKGEFFPLRRPCVLHEWAGMVPGSILTFIEEPAYRHFNDYFISLDGMPPAILAYELEVHARYLEKHND